jgi:hypothetical protein
MEQTADRRVFSFQMIKTVPLKAALAPGGGRSAYSRWANNDDDGVA